MCHDARKAIARATLSLALAAIALAGSACSDEGALLDQARALQSEGDYAASIPPLRQLLATEPGHAEANHRLGRALAEIGQPTLAAWPLERAARSPEYAVASGLLLATIQLETSNHYGAISTLERVLSLAPDDLDARESLAVAQLQARDLDAALATVEEVLRAEPERTRALLLRGTILAELGRHDEAERTLRRLVELGQAAGAPLPVDALHGRMALARVLELTGDVDAARDEIEALVGEFPSLPKAVGMALDFYDRTGAPEAAIEVLERAIAHDPTHVLQHSALAVRLLAAGRAEEAETRLSEAAARLDSADAWAALGELRARTGDATGAIRALERAVASAGELADPHRARLADLAAESGDLERAALVLESISDPDLRDLAAGGIQLRAGDPEASLAAFDRALRRWPSNWRARDLAARAAYALGRFDRAESEWREAYRSAPDRSAPALSLAQLLLARGRHREAIDFARRYVAAAGVKGTAREAPGLVVLARALSRAGLPEDASRAAQRLRHAPGHEAASWIELARIETEANGVAAGLRVLRDSGLDTAAPENRDVLRAIVSLKVIAGDAASARADVESALERAPKDPGLQTLLGRVLLSQGDRDAARDAFDAATREDPLHADAWAALSRLEAREGNLPEAVALATRAIEQSGGAAEHLHQRAGLLNRLGRPREAMDDLEEVVRHDPANAGACNDLAWMLAESGTDLDRALDLATTAVRIEPTRAGFLDTLGWVHLQRGEAKAAAAQLRSAVRLAPMQPEIRDHLNLALRAQGEAPSDGDSDPAAAPSHDGSGRHE